MTPSVIFKSEIVKVNDNSSHCTQDEVAVEEPLEIRLTYGPKNNRIKKKISVTMRTPGDDRALALGFLFTEGIIGSYKQVESVSGVENAIVVALTEEAKPVLHSAERNFYTTSSCGVCGKASIDAIETVSPYASVTSRVTINWEMIYKIQALLRQHQETFNRTGGLHASALFSPTGDLQILKEDVGRHNALDKAIGMALEDGLLPLSNSVLMLSGRISFELVQKAVMAGIKIVVAIGAPSSLAVKTAKKYDMTLVGFLRHKHFNIYSGAQRILPEYEH
ncbi:MAG: formate dehydrogenase accessory sulfurtransferase FdhD [Bacteroidetes bacterium]|nr:formate dehydrogenase accessory sulfurtransferase FdhD [Bacteroidota bacterium]